MTEWQLAGGAVDRDLHPSSRDPNVICGRPSVHRSVEEQPESIGGPGAVGVRYRRGAATRFPSRSRRRRVRRGFNLCSRNACSTVRMAAIGALSPPASARRDASQEHRSPSAGIGRDFPRLHAAVSVGSKADAPTTSDRPAGRHSARRSEGARSDRTSTRVDVGGAPSIAAALLARPRQKMVEM